MKILMLSAEVAPFVTVGGLSQVLFFLSKSLLKADHDVRVFTPFHGKIPQRTYKTQVIVPQFIVPTDTEKKDIPTSIECSLRIYKKIKPITYFVENREYYTLRENVFGYGDDHQRMYLLCKACLEWLKGQVQRKEWIPDVIHAHDWHAGYFIELARTDKRYQKLLKHIPIFLTIHNFRYQGNVDFTFLPPQERDKGQLKLKGMLDPKLQFQNPLLRGILHADWINTVSPAHAIEVLTPEYGEGLDSILGKKRGILSGVINGLNTQAFDPLTDPLIKQNFSPHSLEKRIVNKLDLQKEFGLPVNEKTCLLAYSGRLDKQKGLHLLLSIAEQLFHEMDIQLIILGSGDQQIANEFRLLQQKYPTSLAVHLYADFKLPRKIFAGSDIMLIPSMFEPGGIVALEAMRYGAIPVVRRTGGLSDIITEFDPASKKGNGFSFTTATGSSLLIAITRAIETYKNPVLWKKVQQNALDSDFSWDKSMKEYVKLYKKVIRLRKASQALNPNPAFTSH